MCTICGSQDVCHVLFSVNKPYSLDMRQWDVKYVYKVCMLTVQFLNFNMTFLWSISLLQYFETRIYPLKSLLILNKAEHIVSIVRHKHHMKGILAYFYLNIENWLHGRQGGGVYQDLNSKIWPQKKSEI